MDYRDTVFIKVAENLNLTKHIKELEERYKTNLFERKGNKVYLTRAGEKVYNTFKQIAQQYRELDFETIP